MGDAPSSRWRAAALTEDSGTPKLPWMPYGPKPHKVVSQSRVHRTSRNQGYAALVGVPKGFPQPSSKS